MTGVGLSLSCSSLNLSTAGLGTSEHPVHRRIWWLEHWMSQIELITLIMCEYLWISVNSLYICVSCHYHLFASCVIMKGFNGHAFPRSWETQNKATKCHASCMSTTLASVSKVSHENNWRVPLCRMTRRGTALDGLVHLEWAARNLRLEFRQWNMVILLHYCICIDTYIYIYVGVCIISLSIQLSI